MTNPQHRLDFTFCRTTGAVDEPLGAGFSEAFSKDLGTVAGAQLCSSL